MNFLISLHLIFHRIHTWWQRLTGCLKVQVFFRKRATNCRALLQKMTYKDKASCNSTPPCNKFSSELTFKNVYLCVAVCCSVLQCVAVCCSVLLTSLRICTDVLQCVAVCCSVLQCVAVCCSVLLTSLRIYTSVLQCVAVCCSVLLTSLRICTSVLLGCS